MAFEPATGEVVFAVFKGQQVLHWYQVSTQLTAPPNSKGSSMLMTAYGLVLFMRKSL